MTARTPHDDERSQFSRRALARLVLSDQASGLSNAVASLAVTRYDEFSGAGGAPQQNALMRAFNTADRDRDEVRADFSLAWPGVVTAFNVTWADDDYPGTAVGRTSSADLARLYAPPRALPAAA